MLAKARQILVSELALAEQTNEDKAESLLDEVLASLIQGRNKLNDVTARRSIPRVGRRCYCCRRAW